MFKSKIACELKPHSCLLPESRSSRCLMLLCSLQGVAQLLLEHTFACWMHLVLVEWTEAGEREREENNEGRVHLSSLRLSRQGRCTESCTAFSKAINTVSGKNRTFVYGGKSAALVHQEQWGNGIVFSIACMKLDKRFKLPILQAKNLLEQIILFSCFNKQV